jgi:hypothetical protein
MPTKPAMTNDGVYIHEFIQINGLNRANYVHHMTANWSPAAQEERKQLCYGVWPVVGSTGAWPEVVNMWELRSWQSLADGFALESAGRGGYDERLERWWARAAEFRRGGIDRIVLPAPWNRTIDELCADGVRGECYTHDLVTVVPGAQLELMHRVRDEGGARLAIHGAHVVGTFRTAMANDDECIVITAYPTWSSWAKSERSAAAGDEVTSWRASLRDVVTGWKRVVMIDSPLSPLRTGRQPSRADQVDWDETTN